jgi:hypothetical protein
MTVGTVPGVHPAAELLNSAAEMTRKAVSLLAADEVWTASSADLVGVLHAAEAAASAVSAVQLSAVREIDVRGIATADGQASTAAWLGKKLTLVAGEAKARVENAAMLAVKAPATMAALTDGQLNPDQARAIAKGLARIEPHASAEEFAQAEEFLRTAYTDSHAGHIARAAERLQAALDPDGDPQRKEKAWRSRELTITDLGGGRHRLRGTLTDEGAATLKAVLDPLAAPRPALDGERDPRSAAQRMHDALIDLAGGYLRFGVLPESRGARPHVNLTVVWDDLKAGTADALHPGRPFSRVATGEELDPDTVRKICCDAGITPVIVNTLGEPLNVGREHRSVTPPIWTALVARDLGCVFPDCTRPPHWCQAHHLVHWIDGGETSLENCALVCDFHHDQIHHHGWQIRLGPHGHPELIPPPWIDPLQQPRRNTHWKLCRDGLHTEPDRGP